MLAGANGEAYVEFKGGSSDDWGLTHYNFQGIGNDDHVVIEVGINGDDGDVSNEKFYVTPKGISIEGHANGTKITTPFEHHGTAYIKISGDLDTGFVASFDAPYPDVANGPSCK